jgi:hypothetical protein
MLSNIVDLGLSVALLVFLTGALLMWIRVMLVWALDIGKLLRKFGRKRVNR